MCVDCIRPVEEEEVVVKDWLTAVSVVPRCTPEGILSALSEDDGDDSRLVGVREQIGRMIGRNVLVEETRENEASVEGSVEGSVGGGDDDDDDKVADMRVMDERESQIL